MDKTSCPVPVGRIARPRLRRLPRLLGLAVALASTVCAAAGEGAFERALAEQARYLATEALAYEHGEGVPRDQSYAALLYCESARLGDSEGMYALGWMYDNGKGIRQSDTLAKEWYQMACDNGNEDGCD